MTIQEKRQKTVVVRQIASPLRRDPRQSLYLKSLGLGKMNRTRELIDSPSVRGLISKVSHMIRVIEQSEDNNEC